MRNAEILEFMNSHYMWQAFVDLYIDGFSLSSGRCHVTSGALNVNMILWGKND